MTSAFTTNSRPHPPRQGWGGELMLQPGLMVFSGAIGAAATHAHAAIQLVLVTKGEIVLRDPAGTEQSAQLAMIPAGVGHELRAESDATGVVAFLDPASRAGRAATNRLRRTLGDPAAVGTWIAAAEPTHRSPAGRRRAPQRLHPALTDAVSRATALIAGPLLLTDLADHTGISASRLGHLFAAELGLPYPAWRRWLRLQHAITAAREGASLTDAAHGAGFADSAHLTRVCRAMFGITPTAALHAAGWRPAQK